MISWFKSRTDMRSSLEVFRPMLGRWMLLVMIVVGSNSLKAQFQIPKPSGDYGVGTQHLSFYRDTQQEPGGQRRLMYAQVWYPTDELKGDRSTYWPADLQSSDILPSIFRLPKGSFQELRLLNTNAIENASVSNRRTKFPLVIFSHGYSFWTTQNTLLMEHLSSNGFITLSIAFAEETIYQREMETNDLIAYDFGNESLKKGWAEIFDEEPNKIYAERIAEKNIERAWELEQAFMNKQKHLTATASAWSQDIRSWIEQMTQLNSNASSFFFNKVDAERVAVVGHSFGGSASVLASTKDKRIRAAVNIDGSQYGMKRGDRLKVPVMFLHNASLGTDINAIYYKQTQSDYFSIQLKNSGHLNFCDMPFFAPFLKTNPRLAGTIDQEKASEIVNELVLSFLKTYLSDSPSSLKKSLDRHGEAITLIKD